MTQNDEELHRADPADWSWSESWFFSFIDLDGGPACTFRVGVLPNQHRAMLWCFVFADGAWLTVEESRLALEDLDFTESGVAYDKWALRFASTADEPMRTGRFTFEGVGLARSGPDTGARVPFAIDLTYLATVPVHDTGVGDDDASRTGYPTGRFEQSLTAHGSVSVAGSTHPVRAGAHRDRSWGPRDWRHCFAIGDVQADDRQLYFVGRSFPGQAGGYVRNGSDGMRRLICVEGEVHYDDRRRTIGPSHLAFETPDGSRLDVALQPVAPSIVFDIAHTVSELELWLYWRTLVEARVSGWGDPARGWFEAGRYGVA